MLIPLERMRVGISSERASHTQTPGPTAKKAMKRYSVMATSQPFFWLGTGVTSAASILRGAVFAPSRLAEGDSKNAATLPGGRLLRSMLIAFAATSLEMAALLARWKSPYE